MPKSNIAVRAQQWLSRCLVRAWLDTVVLGALELALRAYQTCSGESRGGKDAVDSQGSAARHAFGVPNRSCSGGRRAWNCAASRLQRGLKGWEAMLLSSWYDGILFFCTEHLGNTRAVREYLRASEPLKLAKDIARDVT